jgi:esterase/lipase superfamily enzyme
VQAIVRGDGPVKATERWHSERMQQDIGLARWGHYGTPVLVFPTAGGDAEEIERNHLVDACGELIESGRVKLYSCDSVAGQAMVSAIGPPAYRMRLLNQFHDCVRQEVLPAIYADLGGQRPQVIATGASIGAFNALAVLCRYPDVFSAAVGMSGTYRVERFYDGEFSDDLYFSSPVHFVPNLEGPQLDTLKQRFAILASGQGAWEDVGESWHAGDVLGRKGVPNRVDAWGTEWPHEWPTWRRMLPQYLDELC